MKNERDVPAGDMLRLKQCVPRNGRGRLFNNRLFNKIIFIFLHYYCYVKLVPVIVFLDAYFQIIVSYFMILMMFG